MSYEIPPNLQHKEKIIFNLTFEQLLYAGAALIIDAIIFKIINNSTVKFTLIGLITSASILLMFFNAKQWIKNFYHFVKFRKADVFSENMKEYIGIKDIKDNLIINNKEQKIALLEVQPINFNIKTETEQEAIIIGFQKLLNSIDFPIQIIVASEPISLDEHFNKLSTKIKNNFKNLFEDYKKFITDNITVNEIKNRKFYIIIKEKNNIEIELNVLQEKLKNIGLKVERIYSGNNILLNKLNDYFNPNKDENVEVKEGAIINNMPLFSPKLIENNRDYLKVNNSLNRIVAAAGYPNNVEKGFLDRIISGAENYDVSVHINPFPIDFMLIQLNNELKKQRADMYSDSVKSVVNPSLEIKYAATRKTLEELQKGSQKLFNVSLYINCKTKPIDKYKVNEEEIKESIKTIKKIPKETEEQYNKRIINSVQLSKAKKELDLLTKKVSSDLNSIMIQPKVPIFRQSDAYKSITPTADDSLKLNRNIATEALSAFFPFTSPFLSAEPEGILLGLNKNRIPFIKDIYKLTNANGLVLATSGGGKSYFTKLLITRLFMQGSKVIVIDPQGEYSGITSKCNGEIITIGKHSDTIINPFDLMGQSYEDKRLSLIDLFKVMLGDLNEVQKAILDKAINLTYEEKGIKKDSDPERKPPIISDLYNNLDSLHKQASVIEKPIYSALINRLYIFTEKGVFGFLDRQTNINFSNDFVCFNLGLMPRQVKPVIMFLVLDYIYSKMKEDLSRKLLVIDEAWSLLSRAEEEGYIFEIVKTCRKFNLGLLMITQDVKDLVDSKAGHAALANSSYTFLLRQKPAVIESVSRVFHLSKNENNFLLTCNVGHGLLILDNEHQELEIKASSEEHKLITTNPDEIIKQNNKEEISEKEDHSIKLDLTKSYYEGNKLKLQEKEFLKNHGYSAGYFHKFNIPGPVNEYFVKESPPEGLMHAFLAAITLEYIKTKTDKITRRKAVEPDIVFEDKNNRKWAIEIETGEFYKQHKERLNEKFVNLKNKYGNRGLILLTDMRMINNYKKYDIKIIGRSELSAYIDNIFS